MTKEVTKEGVVLLALIEHLDDLEEIGVKSHFMKRIILRWGKSKNWLING